MQQSFVSAHKGDSKNTLPNADAFSSFRLLSTAPDLQSLLFAFEYVYARRRKIWEQNGPKSNGHGVRVSSFKSDRRDVPLVNPVPRVEMRCCKIVLQKPIRKPVALEWTLLLKRIDTNHYWRFMPFMYDSIFLFIQFAFEGNVKPETK